MWTENVILGGLGIDKSRRNSGRTILTGGTVGPCLDDITERSSMRGRVFVGAVCAFLAPVWAATARDFPAKPVTMVIPFDAGGPTDVLGRVVGARMSEILRRPVMIENIGGGGGTTGSRRVADARPDGYTFVLGTVGTHAQAQNLYRKPLYNAVTAFAPVALLAEVPIILTVRKDLPPKDFKEFAAYAQANQKQMQFGSAGAGSATHLGCVLLHAALKIDVNHIPYRGTGPALQDLAAGNIDYLCEIITTAKPQVDGGAVRALAIFDRQRSPALPDLPTALEQDGKDIEAYTWNAIFMPRNAPAAVVNVINNAAVQALKTPAARERLQALGARIVSEDRMTPAYLAGFLKREIDKWAAPIKASGASIP
jgi:tripartite-type tricarboxylate transporter receptor subunit TctC